MHRDATDATLAPYHFVYDDAGRITQLSHHGQTSNYSYDASGQLTAAANSAPAPAQPNESYTYDANGNRVSGGTVLGPGNRLLSDGTFQYTYDNEGNLTAKTETATGQVTSYAYDYRNRLTSAVTTSSGGIILREATYIYDVFDRRIAKTVDPDGAGPQGAVTTRFVYNGAQTWADLDAAGTVAARYLYGEGLDQLLARFRPGEGTSWYLTDHLGTVRDIANALGQIVDHLEYDSFGNVLSETNSALGDRFRFTAREFDAETGLYYYRARYFDPRTGRFISEDPLSFAAGDPNLYRYVANNPLQFVDPIGLELISYAKFAADNPRIAGAIEGFAFGYACGFLEGWYATGTLAGGRSTGLEYGSAGAVIGFALAKNGFAATVFGTVAAYLVILDTARQNDGVLTGIRVLCFVAPAVLKGNLNWKSVKNFLADESGAAKIPRTGGAQPRKPTRPPNITRVYPTRKVAISARPKAKPQKPKSDRTSADNARMTSRQRNKLGEGANMKTDHGTQTPHFHDANHGVNGQQNIHYRVGTNQVRPQ